MKTLNEYCLCAVKGLPVPPVPAQSQQRSGSPSGTVPPPPPITSTYSASPLMGGLAGLSLAPSGGRKTSRGGAPPVPYDPDIATRIGGLQPESSSSSLNSSVFSTGSGDARFGGRGGPLIDRANSMVRTYGAPCNGFAPRFSPPTLSCMYMPPTFHTCTCRWTASWSSSDP